MVIMPREDTPLSILFFSINEVFYRSALIVPLISPEFLQRRDPASTALSSISPNGLKLSIAYYYPALGHLTEYFPLFICTLHNRCRYVISETIHNSPPCSYEADSSLNSRRIIDKRTFSCSAPRTVRSKITTIFPLESTLGLSSLYHFTTSLHHICRQCFKCRMWNKSF